MTRCHSVDRTSFGIITNQNKTLFLTGIIIPWQGIDEFQSVRQLGSFTALQALGYRFFRNDHRMLARLKTGLQTRCSSQTASSLTEAGITFLGPLPGG